MTIARMIEGRDQTIASCTPDESVEEASRRLADRRIGALPVLEDGAVVGIFSERDLLYCIGGEGAAILTRPVREVMTAPVITASPSDGILYALSLMTSRRIRHLPVCEGERLVAFISIGDLVKYRLDAVEAEANQMREYIRTA